MTGPLRVESGELTADEILAALEAGRGVVVETEMLGSSHEITLRYADGIYYCDTPTTLHKHDSEDAMRACIAKHGYARE